MSSPQLFDPNAEATLADPIAVYRRLRDEAPVYYIESWRTWALSRFEDIWKWSNDAAHFTATAGTTAPYLVSGAIQAAENLNHMDPPRQPKLRKALMQFFLPGALRKREVRIREVVRGALETLVERGSADVVTDVGRIVATRVASDAIGFPESDGERIHDFMTRFFSAAGGAPGTEKIGAQAMQDMRSYLAEIAASRRSHTGEAENVIDVLLRTDLGEGPLDADAIGEHLVPLLVGATETFPKFASAAIYRLWQHPDQRSLLAQDPSLISNAVRECLRLDMPTQMSMRRIQKDLTLHGQHLKRGESVMFLWASGNRDERVFERPDELDVRRRIPRTLSFGNGIHRCLGGHLAELEGRVLLEELLARAPEYQVDEAGIERTRNAFFNAHERLPIRLA
jgi:cytochrome P450